MYKTAEEMEKEAIIGAAMSLGRKALTAGKSLLSKKPLTTRGTMVPNARLPAAKASTANIVPHSGRTSSGSSGRSAGGFADKAKNFMINNPRKTLAGGAAASAGLGYAAGGPSKTQKQNTYMRGYMRGQRKVASVHNNELNIPVEKFSSRDTIATVKTAGLHVLNAKMEKLASGRDFCEIDLAVAVTLLGEKSFIKRAEQKKIRSGLQALAHLRGVSNV